MSESREIRRAYYYSFESTGVDAVDDVLDSVGIAGKAYHYTQDWNEHDEDFNEGKSQIEMIQEAANKAALEFEKSYQEGFEAGKKTALQWQPIETAPKDGTLILVYYPDNPGKGIFEAYASPSGYVDSGEFNWIITCPDLHIRVGDLEYAGGVPTHWMPLPSPPAPEVSE